MDNDFVSKRVLVIGGASGIGLETVKRFLSLGSKVAVMDINEKSLSYIERQLKKISDQFLCLAGDVRSRNDVNKVIDQVTEFLGGIDILVYSAGIFPDHQILEMSEDEWDLVMDINVKGAFLSCKSVAKQMITQGTGGHIVTISSGSYRSGRIGSGHYCASKGALVMFTKVLAMELAKYEIMVNSIAPGLVDNPILDEKYKQEFVKRIPMGRIGKSEDVSSALTMITSSENTFMTGQVVSIDGGLTAGHFGLPLSNKK